MRNVLLLLHVVAACGSLAVVGWAWWRRRGRHEHGGMARLLSLAAFGIGVVSGIGLLVMSPDGAMRGCLMMVAYVGAYVLAFGYLWGEDPADCPYLREKE